MSRFDPDAERLIPLAGEGMTLQDACEKAGVPYETARAWITKGRRDPTSRYAAGLRRLESARTIEREREAGPVERRLDALLRGRELTGENALAAEQARTLAAKIDQLGATPGAAAGQALAHCSRRLEEIIPGLGVPREDSVDRLRQQRAQRIAEAQQANGKGSGEVKLKREGEW